MSHITQRQLHWLCGEMTTTGMEQIWCAAASPSGDSWGIEMETRALINPSTWLVASEFQQNMIGKTANSGAGSQE